MARLAIVAIIPLLVIAGAVLLNRPRPERFLEINGLEGRPGDIDHVRSVLRRTYRSRLAGGFVGLALGALAGHRLGTWFTFAGAGIGFLMGTMLGIAVAQARRADAAERPSRSASLAARDPDNYRPTGANISTTVFGLIVFAYGIVAITTANGDLGLTSVFFGIGFATLLAIPTGRHFQRRTVEMRRGGGDAMTVRVDDAIRASAVRGIHHATVGVLMGGLLLIGFGATSTQSFEGIMQGNRVLVRTPPLSRVSIMDWMFDEPPPAPQHHVEIRWVEPDGSTHRARFPVTRLTRSGTMVANSTLLSVGRWVGLIGFFGMLIQWGHAARAWKQPQRCPVVATSDTSAPLGATG